MDSEKRFIIAIALSLLIFMAWSWLTPTPPPPPEQVPEETVELTEPERPQSRDPVPAPDEIAADPEAPEEPQVVAQREEEVVVDNGVILARFTNRGGRAVTWTLAHYTTSDGEPLQLFPRFENQELFPLSIAVDDPSLSTLLNDALFEVLREKLPSEGSLTSGERITFRWSDGRGLSARKEFEFRQGSYLVGLGLEVVDRGRALPARLSLGPGFAAQEPSSDQSNYYYKNQAVWKVAGDVSRTKPGKLEEVGGFSGPVGWAGIEDQYFTALVIPEGQPGQVQWWHPELVPIPPDGEEVDEAPEPVKTPVLAVSVGEEGAWLFVGPKKFSLLKSLDLGLEGAVWFSSMNWLRPIVKYLFLALVWIHDNVAHNWGLAIVLATLVLRIVLFPVNQYSMVSMKKSQLQMQKLKPKVDAIRNKYKKLKDAQSRGKMNQETMELYRKAGVNPMGGVTGCLPLLAQFPILIGFYNMLTVTVELRGAPFFGWIRDLSQEDPFFILPILMAVTMFAQQKLAMSKIKDPQQLQQQRMMLFMPLVFGFITLQMPSGLVLYWFVNNLLGMGQQWLVNRTAGRLEAAAQKA